MTRAAGIMLMTPGGQVLFLQRGRGGDYPGHWCFPGGRLKEGEDALDAAIRETAEEAGIKLGKDELKFWTRRVSDGVEFTTFITKSAKKVAPKLNYEHTGYVWAEPGEAPEPLHPGCMIALARLDMNELDIARAMAAGELASPHVYANVTLFNMRITGTGTAWRDKWGEYVWRDPSFYLNDDFLARCNGLQVILEHPRTKVLNTEEYKNRAIGAIMLPYIKGDEVWGIAKIYDAPAAELMAREQLSTSPAVVWRNPQEMNDRREMDDGSTVLVEDEPSLLDHLAICEKGVWDKGGEPAGIETLTEGTTIMADDKEKKGTGGTLDKLLAGLDAMNARMDTLNARLDAFEETKPPSAPPPPAAPPPAPAATDEKPEFAKPVPVGKDAAPVPPGGGAVPPPGIAPPPIPPATDAAPPPPEGEKKDEDEKKPPFAFDAASISRLQQQYEELKAMIPKGATDKDYDDFARVQAAADAVFQQFGQTAPRPMQGEIVIGYRKRLAGLLKEHDPRWKDVDLNAVATDEKAFGIIEEQIYKAAMDAAKNPASVPVGELRAVTTRRPTGHLETRFYGSPGAWMARHGPNRRFVTAIDTMRGGQPARLQG